MRFKQSDLATEAAKSLAELRNTANETGTHEDYRSIVDKGVEKTQKDIETNAGCYGFSQQTMLQFKARLKGVLNQEKIHAIGR